MSGLNNHRAGSKRFVDPVFIWFFKTIQETVVQCIIKCRILFRFWRYLCFFRSTSERDLGSILVIDTVIVGSSHCALPGCEVWYSMVKWDGEFKLKLTSQFKNIGWLSRAIQTARRRVRIFYPFFLTENLLLYANGTILVESTDRKNTALIMKKRSREAPIECFWASFTP